MALGNKATALAAGELRHTRTRLQTACVPSHTIALILFLGMPVVSGAVTGGPVAGGLDQ